MPSLIPFCLATSTAIFLCVEAATFVGGPACLENNPDICSTMSGTTPSPATICDDEGNNCNTTYIGGYSWYHSFFVSVTNLTEIGLETTISLEDDLVNCTVTVNDEECNSCTVCDAPDTDTTGGGGNSEIFSADCTNIIHEMEVGRKIECESAATPFYPLALESSESMSSGDDETAEGDGDRETTTTSGSFAACSMGMIPVLAFVVATAFVY